MEALIWAAFVNGVPDLSGVNTPEQNQNQDTSDTTARLKTAELKIIPSQAALIPPKLTIHSDKEKERRELRRGWAKVLVSSTPVKEGGLLKKQSSGGIDFYVGRPPQQSGSFVWWSGRGHGVCHTVLQR